MDLLLEEMARTAELIYEVNTLMKNVGGSMDASFINGAEEGKIIDIEELDDEQRELVEKRKQSFESYNKVISMIDALDKEEKEELAGYVDDLVERNLVRLAEDELAYQNIIELITSPGFSFEGNEEYKQKIIDLKEEYNRRYSITQFYERMDAYLTTYKKK
jgi:hypothetical protein